MSTRTACSIFQVCSQNGLTKYFAWGPNLQKKIRFLNNNIVGPPGSLVTMKIFATLPTSTCFAIGLRGGNGIYGLSTKNLVKTAYCFLFSLSVNLCLVWPGLLVLSGRYNPSTPAQPPAQNFQIVNKLVEMEISAADVHLLSHS